MSDRNASPWATGRSETASKGLPATTLPENAQRPSAPALASTQMAHHRSRRTETDVSLPQIVVEDTDLAMFLRRRREDMGIPQFELDQITGIQDGYLSKLEAPGREYGRRPTRLTKPLSITWERDAGKAVEVGRFRVDKPASAAPVITEPAYCWLESLGVALVLMDKADAEALCARPKPMQSIAGLGRTGLRNRRVSIEWRIEGVRLEPVTIPPVNLAALRACARAMARALARGSAGAIAGAAAKARAAGLDPEALAQAVQMDRNRACALSERLARVAAYMDALEHPDVKVRMIDVMEHQRDESETEGAARERAAAGWREVVG